MRTLLNNLLKLAWGGFLLFTSMYCLLAFLPYTHYALIKAPPYAWLTWLVQYHAAMYWFLLLTAILASWPGRRLGQTIFFTALILGGGWLAWRPLLPALENNWTSYQWSLVALLPLAIAAAAKVRSTWPRMDIHLEEDALIGYSSAALAALGAALISATAVLIQQHAETGLWALNATALRLTGWSAISHVVVALVVVSIVNLITLVAAKYRHGASLRRVLLAVLVWIAVWAAVSR
ncbi:MAG: hypothetical protein ACRD2Q_03385, partial [Terriglobales bacterium]